MNCSLNESACFIYFKSCLCNILWFFPSHLATFHNIFTFNMLIFFEHYNSDSVYSGLMVTVLDSESSRPCSSLAEIMCFDKTVSS